MTRFGCWSSSGGNSRRRRRNRNGPERPVAGPSQQCQPHCGQLPFPAPHGVVLRLPIRHDGHFATLLACSLPTQDGSQPHGRWEPAPCCGRRTDSPPWSDQRTVGDAIRPIIGIAPWPPRSNTEAVGETCTSANLAGESTLTDGNCQCRGPVVHPRPMAPTCPGMVSRSQWPILAPCPETGTAGAAKLAGCGNTVCTSPPDSFTH